MKKAAVTGVLALLLAVPACLHSELDACLSEPTYGCLMGQSVGLARELDDRAQRTYALAYVVRVMAATGEREAAQDHLVVINDLQKRIPDPVVRGKVLAWVVRANALMGQLADAQDYAGLVTEPYYGALAYAWLGHGQAMHNDRAGAIGSINRALSLAEQLEPGPRSLVVGRIAGVEAVVGRSQRVLELVQTAYDLVDSQTDLSVRISVSATIAVALADAGYRGKARAYLQDALDILEVLESDAPDARTLASAISYVIWAQAVMGEMDMARPTFKKLLKTIRDENQPVQRSVLLGVAAFSLGYGG